MKNITLKEAIEALENCAAVIVDDSTVTFPEMLVPEDDDGLFLRVESRSTEEFAERDNQAPQIDQDRLVLFNTRGERTAFTLLDVVSLKR